CECVHPHSSPVSTCCVCFQVLATGLSGLYSSLPARLQVYSEDWHCLDQADWQQVPALVHFLHSLDFCSAVTKVAHPSIRTQLLGYIYNGFLVPVLAPALHKLTVEEVMTTTAYLELFLRSIPEPALLQTFLSFILLHTHDNVHILDTLVSRVNTPFQLGTVSLALFRTLIGLFCEDVMLQLVFRYLIPCKHLSRRQRCFLKLRDCYSSSAASFLHLLPSWCPGNVYNTNSEHIHWPKGADLSVSDSVGYCRGSDFLMDVNYLHYLWDARQAISISHRACQLWSAPYDGVNPSPQEYRSDTPADDLEDEEEIIQRVKSDSICSLVTTPPPLAFSPTPSSSDTVSMGNQTGRASSTLELEWDDIFEDDDPSLSAVINTTLTNGSVTTEVDRCSSTPAPPPLPPRHIQEMRRTATKLVHGSYVEESEFQDDVLVYDLVSQKDTKSAILERIMAANRRARGSISNGQRVSTAATTTTITTILTTTGRTVMETVNSIMSTRRRSEDGGKEERRWSQDYGKEVRRRSEDCEKDMWRRKEEGEAEIKRIDEQGEPNGRLFFTNGFNTKNHIIDECDDSDENSKPFKNNGSDFTTTNNHIHTHHNTQHPTPSLVTNALPNGHSEIESHDPLVSAADTKSPSPPANKTTSNDDFLSRYQELMLSLGVEPDCDDITDNIGTFRKRVRALRQKLEEEVEGLDTDIVFSSLWDDREEEGEEEAMEEEEEEEEGEEKRKGNRRHGVPFTGPFISVLLSRLENLLENSIAVNLLVTGILSQLASYPYPQPLLRSFLLSTDANNQPNVRTLYQVLVSVHNQIERYVEARPDYPALVTQAWRFLLAKDQDSKFRESLQPQGGDIILDPSLPNGSVRNALALPPLSILPPCPPIPPQAKNRVFAIVLYAEFLKELAAIAQEHSIAPDCAAVIFSRGEDLSYIEMDLFNYTYYDYTDEEYSPGKPTLLWSMLTPLFSLCSSSHWSMCLQVGLKDAPVCACYDASPPSNTTCHSLMQYVEFGASDDDVLNIFFLPSPLSLSVSVLAVSSVSRGQNHSTVQPSKDSATDAAGYVILVLIIVVIIVLCVILYILRRVSRMYSFDLQRPSPVDRLSEPIGTFEPVYLDDLDRPPPKENTTTDDLSPPAVANGTTLPPEENVSSGENAPQEQPDANGVESSPAGNASPSEGDDPADKRSSLLGSTNLFFDITGEEQQNGNNNNPCT
ncbi:hypothetical protein L3Q82_016593, partial [Scortum barcoo]